MEWLARPRKVVEALRRSQPLREHLLLSAIIAIGRAALHVAGLRFNPDLGQVFLSDLRDLRERLWETFYYSHSYPPGMNLLTGAILKLGGSHTELVAREVMQLFGLLLANSLFYLCRVSGLSKAVALGVALAFAFTPPSIYFEHLYIYACPVAAILCLAAALFRRAVARESFWAWFAFFLTCSVLGWIRSTFHLAWLVAMIGLAMWFARREGRFRILAAAAAPVALLLGLYVKNLAAFGVFGATTFAPAHFTTITIRRMPRDLRETWVQEGKLSPYASVDVYSGPRGYTSLFPSTENDRWPVMMNLLERPTVWAPNYNHWYYLEVNPRRRADALYYLKTRPLEYVGNVAENLKQMFGPSTKWHALDKTERSPHHQHRQVLGGFEAVYNGILHGFPSPIGLYLLAPLAFGWGVVRARSLAKVDGPEATATTALLTFCLIQIVFVIAAGILLAFGEAPRYRYDVEALIWFLAALAITDRVTRFRQARG